MKIGIPREIKADENRVAITPAGVSSFVKAGHEVYIEKGAGAGSWITDEEYRAAGGKILDKAQDVFEIADMVMKVKEPLPPEYGLLTEGKILFTYLHLAPEPELTSALLKNNVTGIAYETVQKPDGSLPLLTPMSEVAGKMATQIGAHLLERRNGGRGVLMGGVSGVAPANVTVIGGGVVGGNAAKVAVGMGARVTVFDLNIQRLHYLDDVFGGRVSTSASNPFDIAESVKTADLLVGAVLVPGARAPKLVTEDMVKTMRPGAVIVDVAIDQGGSVETIDRVTTHSNPTYVKHGVVHYSVANMPGAVPRTSTFALTNATLPYALALANKGYVAAVKEDRSLALGVNTIKGALTYKAVADAHKIAYTPLDEVLG